MATEAGRGAQVRLAGVAQAAARGAVAGSVEGNSEVKRPMDAAGDPGTDEVGSLGLVPYAGNDVDAAARGVPVGGMYCNTAGVQQRRR